MSSRFRSWNGVEPHELHEGVTLQAIGGEQLLLLRVHYEPGMQAPSHRHDEVEQVMVILDGSATMTIEDEQREVAAGDVIVVNRGLAHSMYSEGGVTFFEALSPVPLDHVPDVERDLVLGPFGGSLHVER